MESIVCPSLAIYNKNKVNTDGYRRMTVHPLCRCGMGCIGIRDKKISGIPCMEPGNSLIRLALFQ